MPLYGMHDQRDRAESFGAFAEQYDRYRPGYPIALVDDLMLHRPRTVLDIACGTGKAGVPFVARGLDVLGVEPDAAMAAVARRHGLEVDVDRFEDWDPKGRRFDLITCGHAWHWLDPSAKDRLPDLLTPGGVVARFWTYHVFDAEVVEALDRAYAGLPEQVHRFGHDPSTGAEPPDPLRDVPGLTVLPSRTYRSQARITAEVWTGRIATYSDHQKLGRDALATLQERVRLVFDQLGGSVTAHCGVLCLLARRS